MLNYIYSEVSVHLSSLFTFKMNAIRLICPEEKLLHSNMTYYDNGRLLFMRNKEPDPAFL